MLRALAQHRVPFLCSVLVIAALAAYFATSSGGYDVTDHIIGRDFANTHLGGVILNEGRWRVLFDSLGYWNEIKAVHGADYPVHNWSYPPLLWPLSQGLALLPYFAAYALWTAVGMGLVWLATRLVGLDPVWAILIILSPAGLWTILAGQNAFIISSLLVIAATLTHQRRALIAGFTWVLVAVKPHLGICVLPLLFGQRRWGVILWGGLFLIAALGASVWAYGTEPWRLFFTLTTEQQARVAEQWTGLVLTMVPSAFMQGRLAGFSADTAYGLHLAVMVVGTLMLYWRWWLTSHSLGGLLMWLVVGTILLLPYSFTYDMIMLHIALAVWWTQVAGDKHTTGPTALAFAGLWMLPWLSFIFAELISVQITPIVMVLFLVFVPGFQRPLDTPHEST